MKFLAPVQGKKSKLEQLDSHFVGKLIHLDFLTLMPLNGYNFTNIHCIGLKVTYLESEEHFTHFE